MLRRNITAGTGEKGDAQITVSPLAAGREIAIEQLPHERFRAAVTAAAERVLEEEHADGVRVSIRDCGALEFVIEARLRAAIREAERT